ncbi:sulfotransferase [Rhodobacteraceae bacterium]|nr:sulfotransferase [Paracoccaceae bacterium]
MNVVFFCIGAAKAGTSWLHRQLTQHPQCHLRSIKELHYFDALEGDQMKRELSKHRDLQKDMLNRLVRNGSAPDVLLGQKLADRAAWLDVLEAGREDVPAYLDYLNDGAAPGQVVGEVTPAYALLPEKRLRVMARITDDVRFFYMLRDPVERLWSHVRMSAARRDDQGRVTPERTSRILQRVISGAEPQIADRGDYAGALARLSAAVPGPQVLVEAIENMVAGNGLRRLCGFLGIAPMTGDLQPVHAGLPLDMTRDQRKAAADWLAPQYDAAERALGSLPKAWLREG